MMKRFQYLISGRVQGVGFRWQTLQATKAIGVTGFVKNLPSGQVLLEAQGEPEQIVALKQFILQDMSYARIDSLTEEPREVIPDETIFQILR